MRELDYLLRRLDDLDQLLKMERNHLQNGQAMPDMPQVVLADIEQTIAALQQQREALAQTIKAHCKRHPQLQTLYRQLLGVPGIGLQSVLPLIVILYRFDALSAGAGGKKQLTAFLGLDSQIRQSGTSVSGVPLFPNAAIPRCGPGSICVPSAGFGATMCCVSFIVYSWRGQSKKSCAGCLRSQNSPLGLGHFPIRARL
ncbi:MAG: hypothetical protein R2932_30090 [Caldilineaceae bacterium]